MQNDRVFHSQPSTSAHNPNIEIDPSIISNAANDVGVELSAQDAACMNHSISSLVRSVLSLAQKLQKFGRRRQLATDDVDSALAFYGITSQLGYDLVDNVSFKLSTKSGKDYYLRDDQEVDLSAVTNALPPRLPLEHSARSHWLVISGVQPAIPENPPPKITGEVFSDEPTEDKTIKTLTRSTLFLNQFAKSMPKTEHVQIKSMTTHSLSLEQQVFFKEIIETIMGSNEDRRKEALNYLQRDTGLNSLIPRFSVTIVEGVRCNIVVRNVPILIYLMRMVQALCQNPNTSLERCLHDIIPAVMSCILSRQLSDNIQLEAHWTLREFSSRLLAHLIKSSRASNILSRVTYALSRVFDDQNCPMTTLYGAIYSISELGFDSIRSVFIPKVCAIHATLQRVKLNKSFPLEYAEYAAVDRIYALVVKTLIGYMKDPRCAIELRTHDDYLINFGDFGEEVYRQCATNNTHNNV